MQRPGPTLLVLLILALCPYALASAQAPESRAIPLSDGVDITLATYPAEGETLALWLAPSSGFRPGQREVAAGLAGHGVEVWMADVADALFLTRGSDAMRSLDGRYVADLITRAHEATGKRIVLISSSYGAIPLLRGVRTWQTRDPAKPYVIGAVLFSPNLYTGVPALGQPPQYLPIARATNIPILLYQGANNANRWQLDRLLEALREGGASVYVAMMPGVTGLFFDEEDEERAPTVQARLETLPDELRRALPLLAGTETPLAAAPIEGDPSSDGAGLDAELRAYEGTIEPTPIRLSDAHGEPHTIDDFRGRVTVVNFWATWCPPCVEEIPSLNRLRQAMADEAFRLISVNYAESPQKVRQFMEKVDVDYPVLMDTSGEVAARWNVVVFPSTFVIGPKGRIRYGVNAAIAWDAPEVIRALRRLLDGQGASAGDSR